MICEEFLWAEKYRPHTIDECILPKRLKKMLKDFVKKGELPHFLFTGRSGIGKTTVARAICDEINTDVLFINASLNNGIDTLRTTVAEFAATVSISGGYKTVILDEADSLNASSTQLAMRAFMEEFSSNCRFILTCNFPSKILDAIESRCVTLDFTVPRDEQEDVAVQFFKRTIEILKAENIEFDPKVVAELVNRHYPDFRKTLEMLHAYSASGKIDSGVLIGTSKEEFRELFGFLKDKKFNDVRKWVASNSSAPSDIFRELFECLIDNLEDSSVPSLILILRDADYKSAFVTDQEVNTMACLTEIMAECRFK